MKRLILWIYSKLGSSINKYPRVELTTVPFYYNMDANFQPKFVYYPYSGFIVYLNEDTPVPYTLLKRASMMILTDRFVKAISATENLHLCPIQLAREEMFRSNMSGIFDPREMNSHYLLGGTDD